MSAPEQRWSSRLVRERAAIALVAAALTLVYLVPFRAYGLNVDDEGTLLYELQRVLAGDLPYVDFRTGYTPGFFYASAALWGLAGDVPTFRALLACLHALTVAGLAFLLARRVRPMLALGVPLLYLAFIPVFPGDFCAFNVPYPAWFATAAWVATAGAMVAFVERRRRVWLVVAGLAAAAALGMKPNAGVFAIAAAAAVVLAVEARPEEAGQGTGALWLLLWAGVLGGVAAAFGVRVRAVDALVYLAPLAAALAALITRARLHRPGLTGDVLALLVPFVLASAPWLAFFVQRLGREDFIREVLLIGSGAAELYYAPYPVFTPWALVVVALVLAVAVSGALVRRRGLRPAVAAAAMLVALAAALGAVLRLGLMPERLTWSIIWQLESAAFPLVLAAHVAGVAWLWRRRHASPAWAVVLVLFALFMHLQLYPRADFMHLVGAAPLTAVLAAVLLDRVLRWWEEGTTPSARRAVSFVTGSLLVGAIVLRVSPSLAALAAAPRFILPFAVAPVGVEREHAADLTRPGERGDDARAGGRRGREPHLSRHRRGAGPDRRPQSDTVRVLLPGTPRPPRGSGDRRHARRPATGRPGEPEPPLHVLRCRARLLLLAATSRARALHARGPPWTLRRADTARWGGAIAGAAPRDGRRGADAAFPMRRSAPAGRGRCPTPPEHFWTPPPATTRARAARRSPRCSR